MWGFLKRSGAPEGLFEDVVGTLRSNGFVNTGNVVVFLNRGTQHITIILIMEDLKKVPLILGHFVAMAS